MNKELNKNRTSPETGDLKINKTNGLSGYAIGGARSEALVTEKLSTFSSRIDGGCFEVEIMGGGILNSETSTKNSGVENLKNELVMWLT